MKALRNLRIQSKCHDCEVSCAGFFCQLAPEELVAFESIKITRTFPKGTILFLDGQPATGVYMLCQGKVMLSTSSGEGKVIILEIVEPGNILGLSAAINGVDYETTAEIFESCQVNFVKTSDLVRFLQTHPQACLNALRQLSRSYQTAFRQICSLGLSDSVPEKLAQLFLEWSENCNGHNGDISVRNNFTHEQMAEMIGTSRETVTRTLKLFREQELITIKGSDLIIHDRGRLKSLIGKRHKKRIEKTHDSLNCDVADIH